VTWYRKAADQGDVQAQAYIAREQQHMPQTGMAQKTNDALDAAVGDCLASGQFFLIDPTTGQLNLKRSSLRVIVSVNAQ
jgi:TPR repeat protein